MITLGINQAQAHRMMLNTEWGSGDWDSGCDTMQLAEMNIVMQLKTCNSTIKKNKIALVSSFHFGKTVVISK